MPKTAIELTELRGLRWYLVTAGRCIIVIHAPTRHDAMTLTVRLPAQLQQQLDSYCKAHRVTKTQVVTALLTDHLPSSSGGDRMPYELARKFGVLGGFSSGHGDLGSQRKQLLTEKLRAKRPR